MTIVLLLIALTATWWVCWLERGTLLRERAENRALEQDRIVKLRKARKQRTIAKLRTAYYKERFNWAFNQLVKHTNAQQRQLIDVAPTFTPSVAPGRPIDLGDDGHQFPAPTFAPSVQWELTVAKGPILAPDRPCDTEATETNP